MFSLYKPVAVEAETVEPELPSILKILLSVQSLNNNKPQSCSEGKSVCSWTGSKLTTNGKG